MESLLLFKIRYFSYPIRSIYDIHDREESPSTHVDVSVLLVRTYNKELSAKVNAVNNLLGDLKMFEAKSRLNTLSAFSTIRLQSAGKSIAHQKFVVLTS